MNSKQSTTPVEFMPRVANRLATALGIDPSRVKVGTDETGDVSSHWAGDGGLLLLLKNPNPVNPNAGAGRFGFPHHRQLIVKVRTRGGLDPAGDDAAGLQEHWELQDQVIDTLLLLPHTAENYAGLLQTSEDRFPFITPIKHLGAGDDVKRVKDTPVAYESVLIFEIAYIPRVAIP